MLNMITLIYYCHFVKGNFNTRKEGDYDLREKGLTFPEQISWPSYTNITPCPLRRLNVLFCFQFKPVKSTSRQSQWTYCVPKEWGQRIRWCRLRKWLGPDLSRLVGKSLRDNPRCKLRGSNRKNQVRPGNLQALLYTLPSPGRGMEGAGVHTLFHTACQLSQLGHPFPADGRTHT